MNLLSSFAIGATAAVFLSLFYSVARTEWPQNYASARTVLDARIRWSASRYIAFRLVPLFVLALLVSVTTDRLSVSAAVALGTMLAIQLGLTNGRAIFRLALKKEGPNRRRDLLTYHVAVLVMGVCAAVLGYVSRNLMSNFVPAPRDLVFALWTGVFVAVVTVATR